MQLTRKKRMGNGCSDVQNHLVRDFRFIAAPLSEMDLGNAATRET